MTAECIFLGRSRHVFRLSIWKKKEFSAVASLIELLETAAPATEVLQSGKMEYIHYGLPGEYSTEWPAASLTIHTPNTSGLSLSAQGG